MTNSDFQLQIDSILKGLYYLALKNKTYINGFLYHMEIASPDGADYYLFVSVQDDQYAIAKAKSDLRRLYDVATLTVVRIKPEWLEPQPGKSNFLKQYIHQQVHKTRYGHPS